jgi:hypothetical protein
MILRFDAGFGGNGGMSFKLDAGFGGGGMSFKLDAGFGGNGGAGSPPWSSGGRASLDAFGPEVLSGGGSGGFGGGGTGGSFVTATGGGGGATVGRGGATGSDARPLGGSGGFGTSLDSGAPWGDAAGWDGASDGPRWSSCYPSPKCTAGEVLVRMQSPTVGVRGCACMANPCSISPPSCGCASSLCGSATCDGYFLDLGALVCSEKG